MHPVTNVSFFPISGSPALLNYHVLTSTELKRHGANGAMARVARPNWSAVAKHGCKRGQNLAKLTAEEFSLFDNSRPIV